MALEPGTRLGPYEVLAPIGAGGMGEVYKASDTRLNRTVAIKVLPAAFSANPELKAPPGRSQENSCVLSRFHLSIRPFFDVGSSSPRGYFGKFRLQVRL